MFYDIVWLLITAVWIITFLISPLPRKAVEQISYEKVKTLIEKKEIEVKIASHRLAGEVVVSPIYPRKKAKAHTIKVCIARVIFLLFVASYCFASSWNPFIAIFIIAIRSVFLNNLSDDVAKIALGNKAVYDSVSALGGWKYNKSISKKQ